MGTGLWFYPPQLNASWMDSLGLALIHQNETLAGAKKKEIGWLAPPN